MGPNPRLHIGCVLIGSARQQPLDDGFSSVIAWPPYRNYDSRPARKEKADSRLTVSALRKATEKIDVGVVRTFGRR